MLPSSDRQPTALRPRNATALSFLAPRAIGCRLVNSETGKGRLRTTCQTPALSRSHKVSAFLSASRRNRDGEAFVPFGTAAAPIRRELLAVPLICSLTVKVQPPRLVAF